MLGMTFGETGRTITPKNIKAMAAIAYGLVPLVRHFPISNPFDRREIGHSGNPESTWDDVSTKRIWVQVHGYDFCSCYVLIVAESIKYAVSR